MHLFIHHDISNCLGLLVHLPKYCVLHALFGFGNMLYDTIAIIPTIIYQECDWVENPQTYSETCAVQIMCLNCGITRQPDERTFHTHLPVCISQVHVVARPFNLIRWFSFVRNQAQETEQKPQRQIQDFSWTSKYLFSNIVCLCAPLSSHYSFITELLNSIFLK